MITTLKNSPQKVRHLVTDAEPAAFIYTYHETSPDEGEIRVCEVELGIVGRNRGRFGCCVHGHGFRTRDFPLDEAERLTELACLHDASAIRLGLFSAKPFHGPKGRKYQWEFFGPLPMKRRSHQWRTRAEAQSMVEAMVAKYNNEPDTRTP